jgi:hypothetical protein
MDMSLANCWDCPATVSVAMVVPLIVAAFTAAVGVLLLASRFVVVRALGTAVLIVTGLFYPLGTYGVVHYGLVWSAAEFRPSLTLELMVLMGWYGLTVVLVSVARRWVGRGR